MVGVRFPATPNKEVPGVLETLSQMINRKSGQREYLSGLFQLPFVLPK
jgi:hypothetical protein